MSHTFQAIKSAVSDGKIFSVTFIKADGSVRFMVCRTGVTKYRKMPTFVDKMQQKINPNLVTVFDMQAKAYRSFHQDRVLALKTKGTVYNVIGA